MAAAKKAAQKQPVTLHDHIKELRNRLFAVAIVFIGVSAVAYNYKDELLYYLLKPLNGEKLIYLNPAGGFSFIFQVTMYVGMAFSVPFLLYNLYKFVAPALPGNARRHSAVVLLSSLFLLCVGVAFGYLYAIPGALNFLNNFGEGYVTPSLTADSYLNFMLAYTAGLGVLFQLPLVLLLVHWVHPLKPGDLFRFERYMILVAFVGAAMITPTPDVMNQTVIALPIIIMYQIGVIAVCVSVYRAKRRARSQHMSRSHSGRQTGADQDVEYPQPANRPDFPSIPQLAGTTAAPRIANRPQATVAQATTSRQETKQVVSYASPQTAFVARPALSSSRAAPAVAAASQTRKSMDIMIATAVGDNTSAGGVIPRPDRLTNSSSSNLRMAQRSRRAPSVDGIFVA